MTFTFDGLIRFSAEHAGLTNEQFQRDDIEDYVVYNISNIQTELENLYAYNTLSAISVLFEEQHVPLRIHVMMKDNKTRLDYLTILLTRSEFNRATKQIKSTVDQARKKQEEINHRKS